MKNYLKLSRLQVTVLSMILADFIVVSLFAWLQLTLRTNPTVVSANTFGKMTHSLVVNDTGRLYLAWIEKAVKKSEVMFATSVDFGRKWSREVAYEADHFRIGHDEAKLDNISMVIDRNGKAHIAFMQNLRSQLGYGDVYPWTFLYVTNKGGKWSAVEEIRGPWNTDWMGVFNEPVKGIRGYSEGVRGLRIDIDADQVLHAASRHQGWWAWGSALYHHFRAPDLDWRTEEIRWQSAGGVESYDVVRPFYVLRQLAAQRAFDDLGPHVSAALLALAQEKLGQYRGEIKSSGSCWDENVPNNVDCRIQGLPLLFVSPKNELWVFNTRHDKNQPYFQKIGPTHYWRNNQAIHSEVDRANREEWSQYASVPVDIRPDQEIKATFGVDGRTHMAMVSRDSRSVYYLSDMRTVEKAHQGGATVREVDIALSDKTPQRGTIHVVLIEGAGEGTKLLHTLRGVDGRWAAPRVVGALGSGQYRNVNVARRAGESERKYELPLLAVTVVSDTGRLYFLTLQGIPWGLALRPLKGALFTFRSYRQSSWCCS